MCRTIVQLTQKVSSGYVLCSPLGNSDPDYKQHILGHNFETIKTFRSDKHGPDVKNTANGALIFRIFDHLVQHLKDHKELCNDERIHKVAQKVGRRKKAYDTLMNNKNTNNNNNIIITSVGKNNTNSNNNQPARSGSNSRSNNTRTSNAS